MGDINERWEDNAPGKYYIDKNCILCALCVEMAPDMFKESDEGDHDIVYKQPENEDEENLMKEAMEQCPVDAIGDDGE
ncbi:MAG: ferredoxin [Candidatus Omnitrophota bacterium]|jgi:ferredoxin|nr:MAG: ferredoxin [Candidatus Omnitrophota bacterium]